MREITFEQFIATLFIDMEIIYGLLFFTLIPLNDLQSTLFCFGRRFFPGFLFNVKHIQLTHKVHFSAKDKYENYSSF